MKLSDEYFQRRRPSYFSIYTCDNCDKEVCMSDDTEHWGTLCLECYKEYRVEWIKRYPNKDPGFVDG